LVEGAQLRQLIETGAPQKPPDTGYPRVMAAGLRDRAVAARGAMHRAKLEELEGFLAHPDALLSEQHGT
jgi:hypothetical protein